MKPGGVGPAIATTPFWPGATMSVPVVSSTRRTSKPYIATPGLPYLLAIGTTPLATLRIGQPLSVCQ